MTVALVSITLRALLNRRRTLLLALLGALLVVVAVIYRLGNPTAAESVEVTRRLLANFGIGVLLPLVAVIVGTSALGSELDDGTIVYLLAKPVARWRIVLVKLVVAWLVTCVLVAPAIVIAGVIGQEDPQLAIGYAVASILGALEYTAMFMALSLLTSRALIIGLAYVVVWEGVVAGLFSGTRAVSVRQHALAVAESFGGAGAGDAGLAFGFAVAAGAAVTMAAIALAIRRLETVELRGETT
ncbi:MAG: ABC transporter permease [Chloroflexi bacterium]|nr:ABC transporter permease [Chloroflexota bacterium]